jgi:hypothetical protein
MEDTSDLIIGKDGITYKATTLLRKTKISEAQRNKRAKMRLEGLKERKENLKNPDIKEQIIRAEKYIMGYRAHQKNYVHSKKRAEKELDSEIDGKILIALRLRK